MIELYYKYLNETNINPWLEQQRHKTIAVLRDYLTIERHGDTHMWDS